MDLGSRFLTFLEGPSIPVNSGDINLIFENHPKNLPTMLCQDAPLNIWACEDIKANRSGVVTKPSSSYTVSAL